MARLGFFIPTNGWMRVVWRSIENDKNQQTPTESEQLKKSAVDESFVIVIFLNLFVYVKC